MLPRGGLGGEPGRGLNGFGVCNKIFTGSGASTKISVFIGAVDGEQNSSGIFIQLLGYILENCLVLYKSNAFTKEKEHCLLRMVFQYYSVLILKDFFLAAMYTRSPNLLACLL